MLGTAILQDVWQTITRAFRLPFSPQPTLTRLSLLCSWICSSNHGSALDGHSRSSSDLAERELTRVSSAMIADSGAELSQWTPVGSFLNSPDVDSRSIAGSVSPSTKAKSRFSSAFGRRTREQSVEPSD